MNNIVTFYNDHHIPEATDYIVHGGFIICLSVFFCLAYDEYEMQQNNNNNVARRLCMSYIKVQFHFIHKKYTMRRKY